MSSVPLEYAVKSCWTQHVNLMSFQMSNSKAVRVGLPCLPFPAWSGLFLELSQCSGSFYHVFHLPAGCSCLYQTLHITGKVRKHFKKSSSPTPHSHPKATADGDAFIFPSLMVLKFECISITRGLITTQIAGPHPQSF